jgi:hypothetical protein
MIEKWPLEADGPNKKYIYVASECLGVFKIKSTDKILLSQINGLDDIPDPKKVVPFSHMRYAEAPHGSRVLKIAYLKDNDFEYRFAKPEDRNAVVRFLSEDKRVVERFEGQDSLLKTLKKPLIAFAILTPLLSWGYYTAWELEQGLTYHEHLVLILLIAGLGTKTLKVVILVVISIIFLRIAYLMKRRDTVTRLMFNIAKKGE